MSVLNIFLEIVEDTLRAGVLTAIVLVSALFTTNDVGQAALIVALVACFGVFLSDSTGANE